MSERRLPLALVLAAGGSRRMGSPKALLPWGDRPLVAAHVAALAPVADRVVVVVGADAEAVRAGLPGGVEAVENAGWATSHPSDSARLALRQLGASGRVLITPVDVAPAGALVLGPLVTAAGAAVPVGPDGREGHPVVLDREAVARLCAGDPLPDGLRGLLVAALRVPVPVAVGVDFDTPPAFRAARQRGE